MENQIPSWEIKREWGQRCTEDINGNLWVGKKKKGIGMNSKYDKDIIEKIKSALTEVRNERRGDFWFNEKSYIVVIDGNAVKGFEYFKVDINTKEKKKIIMNPNQR